MVESIAAFPIVIGQGDSLVVTVIATDPDGDRLFYDWVTDSRLIIKDHPGSSEIFDSVERSHVFYRAAVPAYDGIAWVECAVRDGKGGFVPRLITVPLRD